MRIGFIGTGSMGSMLIETFIRSGALNPENIVVTNRTIDKAERLAASYPGLQVARSNKEVAAQVELLFICVKPLEFKDVIDQIQASTTPDQTIVSITSPVLIRHLEAQLPCKIAKVIPSITNYVLSGATLCIYGDRMLPEDQERLENLLSYVSAPIRISEEYTRISSDLSSCGPAFLAFFVQKYIDASVSATGISEEEATRLASEMTLGTGKLLTAGGFTPDMLQQRVAVPGGITAEGLRIMEKELCSVFYDLIRTTHAKYEEDLEKVEARFLGTKVD
ncbi:MULTISPECIES: late competence protein ComER [unclassified Paenibacillus]|uniref:late competence protein ComER n=1 Tax=unclassified Paenibacillus TaxID=185978 RepID=UPI001AE7D5EF|nr:MULTISPECIES: late competence protein ComER [unclassified Paenibacillus]MBP1156380.1 competence protein ComER [Paenibacillus sp. PvP091]MBP1168234.1 competence protein ComER [Paenibacillus sp. PvR098]MBP2439262.1 competence protein ComER [Paenibacillus sp. PvP052]